MKTNFIVPAKYAFVVALIITGIATVPVHALTVFCPTNKIIECGATLTFNPPTYANACCTNVTVLPTTNIVSGSSCNSTHTQFWLVSDCCTNFTCSQTVSIVDTTPPAITCSSNKVVQCNSSLTFDQPIASDTCCGTNLNYWFLGSNVVFSSQCQTVWAGRWQVSDCCTNYSSICTQLVTVVDTTPPVFSDCPTNKTVQCEEDWTFGTPTAYDSCCASNPVISILTTITNLSVCPFTYTRIWQAVDCCFNTATCTQIVTVSLGGSCVAGETWTPRESNRLWSNVASSADGSKLVAVEFSGQIYTSADSGLTWTPRESNRDWFSVASSADGSKLVAVVKLGQIYTSADSGLTWTPRASYQNWYSVASSADGSKLVAVEFSGQIYTSTDSGLTWTPRESNRNWSSVASSADGSKLVAVELSGQIYTSTDSGLTWTPRESYQNWHSVASSADGSKLVAVAFGSQIYTSTDSGLTWTPRESNRQWHSVASSADGSKLVAVVDSGQIYTSTDSGLTWTPRESNRDWTSVASSADGSKLVAVAFSGQIYTSGLMFNCAPDKTVDCGKSWRFDPPTPAGKCYTNLQIAILDTRTNGICPQVITRTWMVIDDCCGNTNTCSQTITVLDSTPPEILYCYPDKTNQCDVHWIFDRPIAQDNCCPTNSLTYTLISSNLVSFSPCRTVWEGQWQVSDCCTNYSTICTQRVTVVDTTPPVFTNCPSNKTIQCGLPLVFDAPTASDSCCLSNVSFTTTTNLDPCSSTYVRIWTATDCCFNSATCTQIVSVVDTTPPVISYCPTNKTIQCDQPLVFDRPVAYDTCCSTNLNFSLLTNLLSSTACEKVWQARWTVSDCCNNPSTVCTQNVRVVDTLAPVFTVIPSNMVFNCTCAGGNIVEYTAGAVDNCNSNITLICTPPSGSRFPVGINPVTCIARDTCGNQTNYSFTITILSNCPVYNCITIQCPAPIRLPCDGFDNTLVNWTVTASNTCSPGNVVTWSDPPSPALFGLGTHYVTCYASNTVLCEVRTCTFTVEIFPRGPRLSARRGSGTFGTNSLLIDYAESCGEFAIEWRPGLGSSGSGGSDWSPISGLPTGSWTQPNQTNNIAERIIGIDLPDWGTRPDASFFRLTSEVKRGKDFSVVATGPFTNAAIPSSPWLTFNRIGVPGQMQVADFGNTHALVVDDVGIVADFSVNNSAWPNRLYGPATFHEAELWVVGYINGPPHPCWFAEAFDTAGQLVDAIMDTNSPSMVTLRSRGLPLHHIKVWTEPNEPVGLVALKGRTDYTLAMGQFGDCLDFTTYSTNTVVPNPWELPGHTIGSTNSLGMVEPSTYIEAGPDGYGNGYHVNYSTTIHLTTNCCRHIQVELIKYAGAVQVSAYDESGTILASHVVTQTGTPYTVDFPPTISPICKLVVTSPDDQTRILRICCLPALQTIPPTPWCPGTNSNPSAFGCNSNATEPVTFQLKTGGLLGDLLHTYLFPHGGFTVFDLGNESLATIATPCSKVVVEVFSENPNNGMELEALDENGFVVAHGGPLEASQSLQTVVLTGPGIKTVRFKCPAAQGYLKAFYGLP